MQRNLCVCPYSIPRATGGGGAGAGSTPLYKPYRYVPPQRVGFLCYFSLKMGIDFVHFSLKLGMVFEGTTGIYDIHVVFIVSIPNDYIRKTEEYANSYFLAVPI